MAGLHQSIESASTAEDRLAAEQVIEAHTKIIAGSFEKGAAYTNLIIVAGYASFFGLWQITRGLVSEKMALWAALLIAMSASVFVFFEVTKTFWSSRNIHELNKIVTDPAVNGSAKKLLLKFEEYNSKQRKHIKVLVPWWYFTFTFTVITGFGAIGIMMFAFVRGLLQ